MIPSALMVSNGKGGVLKTSLAANLAGLAALSGWRVLAVDLDPQGNLASDLGVLDQSDGGAGFLRSVVEQAPLSPLTDVRPGLDLIAGGPATGELSGHLSRAAMTGKVVHGWLERALAPIAGDYNLVVFDSPPGEALIHTLALTAAHYVLIPTQPDVASINGLGAVFGRLLDVRDVDEPERGDPGGGGRPGRHHVDGHRPGHEGEAGRGAGRDDPGVRPDDPPGPGGGGPLPGAGPAGPRVRGGRRQRRTLVPAPARPRSGVRASRPPPPAWPRTTSASPRRSSAPSPPASTSWPPPSVPA